MPLVDEVTTLSQCLSAVDELVNEIADNMDAAALLAHLERGPWAYLNRNAIQTAEEWMFTYKDNRRVRITVPLPGSPRCWSRTKVMRRAVASIIEVEQWPLEVKLDLTVPEALRGE